ncbi:hypothetical protein PCAR4_460030 [Paraburkholderia caribensis]|nr:hypothetical protein PCAR4_460030 [Paraburkholderia caribensis]
MNPRTRRKVPRGTPLTTELKQSVGTSDKLSDIRDTDIFVKNGASMMHCNMKSCRREAPCVS